MQFIQTCITLPLVPVISAYYSLILDVKTMHLVVEHLVNGQRLPFCYDYSISGPGDRQWRGVALQFSVLLLLIFRWSVLWIISVLSRCVNCLLDWVFVTVWFFSPFAIFSLTFQWEDKQESMCGGCSSSIILNQKIRFFQHCICQLWLCNKLSLNSEANSNNSNNKYY